MPPIKNIYRPTFLLLLLLAVYHPSISQVLVHEEPVHKPVYQNKQVRLLNVQLPPGDTSLYHIHHTASVFIFFTSTSTGSQLKGNDPVAGKSIAGHILFEDLAAPHTRVHRVWNADKDTFHVMDIELLYKDPVFKKRPISAPGLELVTDTTWVRAYKLTVATGSEFKLSSNSQAYVVVALSPSDAETRQKGGALSNKQMEGSYYFIKKKQVFSIKNKGNEKALFAIIELPE